MGNKSEAQFDFEEYGIEEVVQGYIVDSDAVEIVMNYIKQLQLENERLQNTNNGFKSHIQKNAKLPSLYEQLLLTNSEFRETLKYYADEKNYLQNKSGHSFYSPNIMLDGGDKARTTLSKK